MKQYALTYTFAKAALDLGVARNTVARWAALGHIPGTYRTPGGHTRLTKEGVQALKDKMQVPAATMCARCKKRVVFKNTQLCKTCLLRKA